MSDFIARELNFEGKILFPEHHLSHDASAFYPSPYSEAAILTIDAPSRDRFKRRPRRSMLRMALDVHKETGMKYLVLAGGVALNCVGNGRILREGPFADIWIQPAAVIFAPTDVLSIVRQQY